MLVVDFFMELMGLLVKIATALLALLSLGLGLFAFFRHPKSHVVHLWFLASCSVFLTAVGYFLAVVGSSKVEAMFYYKIMFVGIIFIPVTFLHFYYSYLFLEKKYKNTLLIAYCLGLVFAVINILSGLIFEDVRVLEHFGYITIFSGSFASIGFLAYSLSFYLIAFYVLFISLFRTDGIRRHQISYFLIAHIIGFVGSVINVLTTFLGFPQYGQFIIWIYPIVVTYGIFFYREYLRISN